jgi:hypothetical protein
MLKYLLEGHVAVDGGRIGNAKLVKTNFLAGIRSGVSLRDIVGVTRLGMVVVGDGSALPSLSFMLVLEVTRGLGAFLKRKRSGKRCIT